MQVPHHSKLSKLTLLLALNEADPAFAQHPELSGLLETVWEELEKHSQSRNLEFFDLLQECLESADRELHELGTAKASLGKMEALYRSGGALLSLRQEWASRKRQFSRPSLQKGAWDELQKALAALKAGKLKAVRRWVDRMEEKFLGYYERYENLQILEQEITAESSLCHENLREGVECWLEALQLLAEGDYANIDLVGIESLAERGQRALLAVRSFERELASKLSLKGCL